MSRRLIGGLLVRAYPPETRRSRGDELVGTLLDAGDESGWAFTSNATSLVTAGLQARAKAELARPIAHLALGALCWAAVLMAVTELWEGIGIGVFWGGSPFSFGTDPETIVDMYVIPTLIMVALLAGRNRTVGLLGLVRVAMRLHQSPLIPFDEFLLTYPVQIVGFGLLTVRPRTMRPAGRYLWTIPAACWAFYWLTLLGQISGIGRMTPIIAAGVLLPLAPALALGLGIDWALEGIRYLAVDGSPYTRWTIEFLACLPAIMLLTAAYRSRTKPAPNRT